MKKRRLFFITQTDVATTPYAELALRALAREGWTITVAATQASASLLARVLPFRCTRVDLAKKGGVSRLCREVSTLKALLGSRLGPYDVIYVHSNGTAARAFPALAGPLFGKRLVYQTHDYIDPSRYRLHALLEGSLCRHADLHLNGEYHRGYIYRAQYRITCPVLTVPPNLPACWPVPARDDEMRSLLTGGEPDVFVLISHGGYADLRMTRELLEAFSLLPRRFRLAMTNAQESCPEMDSLLDKFHLAGRIVRLPRTEFLEMLKYTVNADAGVLLYRNNDLGNCFQAPGRFTEYLACGLPLVASDHTGLENLVRRFDLGECVDATKPEDIAAGILRLGQAAKEGRNPRERLRQSFLQHFAFDHWEPLICRAFEELLSGRERRGTAPPPPKWIPGT